MSEIEHSMIIASMYLMLDGTDLQLTSTKFLTFDLLNPQQVHIWT
jgi:hypothetical protein